jgi:uroporphyrinogen decarboxylase
MMTALNKDGEPDYVPVWELIINEPVITKLYGRISLLDFIEKMDLDGVTVGEDMRIMSMISKPRTAIIDDFKVKYVYSGVVFQPSEGPIKRPDDLNAYEFPDPNDKKKYFSLRTALQAFKGRRAIVFLGHDGFEHSAYLIGGHMNLLRWYILYPKAAKELVERVWKYKEEVLRNAVELGADILLTGDDYAFRGRSMMSPKHFREFIFPYLQKAVSIAKKNKLPFVKHTDGNLWDIIDMIVETGIDGLHPLEPVAGMDIGKVKERFGRRVAVLGNVDCAYILPHGTESEVVDAVKETIAKASPGGGHVISSSNSIHMGVKPENYRTMVKAARKYGKYPINRQLVEEYGKRNYVSQLIPK